jgi:membrane-bound lytic murein transglycosylase F
MFRQPPALRTCRARTLNRALGAVLLAAVISGGPVGCSLFENRLERVKSAGELVVLTRTSPTTYFESPEGPAGFEYDLVKAFADSLGIRTRMISVIPPDDLLPRLLQGEGDLAAGLTTLEGRGGPLRYTPPYQQINQQLVYRLGTPWPQSPKDLIQREIEVPSGSRHVDRLNELKRELPELRWTESPDKSSETLLQMVWEGLVDVTIADSHLVSLNRQYFPELMIGFNVLGSEDLAWAFPPGRDDSLYQAAVQFLAGYRQSGELAQLVDRYYGPAGHATFSNMTVYQLRIQNRLPQYQEQFQKAARKHSLDWRLLAAIGYQESYWDPKAASHTGVRGLMMLTEETAQRLKVKDRLNPAQSIEGGARYFREMLDRLPDTITGQDRLWMALAAYNVGFYHLEDARIIAEIQGRDPNRWSDVKECLPLLSQAKWAARVKYGFARGREPVLFVNRVRSYYDVLVRIDDEQRANASTEALKIKAPAI